MTGQINEPGVYDGVLFGADTIVAAFVAERLGLPPFKTFWDQINGPIAGYAGLGVVDGDELLGGVVFHDFSGHDIRVSLAFDKPGWANRRTLHRLFAYAFRQLGCIRMTALTDVTNEKSIKLLRGLGFKPEGAHPHGMGPHRDAVSYGMLADECRWVRGGEHR